MRFAITRRSMSLAAMAAAITLSSTSSVSCDNATNAAVAPFDSKGFPLSYTPSQSFFKNPKPMTLVAAGMRRKNFYIVEVDVYKTGLNLTPGAVQRAKAAFSSNASLSDAIKANEVAGSWPECAIVLKFVRGVTAQQVSTRNAK